MILILNDFTLDLLVKKVIWLLLHFVKIFFIRHFSALCCPSIARVRKVESISQPSLLFSL